METYKTDLWGTVIEAIEETYNSDHPEKLYDLQRGKDKCRVYKIDDEKVFVYATSKASRCGDEEPLRCVTTLAEVKRALRV